MRGADAAVDRWWNIVGWAACVFQVAILAALGAQEPPAGWVAVVVAMSTVVVAVGIVLVLAFARRRRFPTLVWPTLGLVTYAVFGLVDPDTTTVLPGMVTIAFVFIGMTQPRWTACWFLAPALVAYVVGAGGVGEVIWMTVPFVVVMWVFIGEVPAALLARLRQQSAQLAVLARTDPLTGLLNRTVLVEALGATSPEDVVVIVDIDRFKVHNDVHGHLAGDRALVDLATALRVLPGGHWYRYGGDEFVGIFAGGEVAAVRAEIGRVRLAVEGTPIAFSIGVAAGGETALACADADLYRAKATRP